MIKVKDTMICNIAVVRKRLKAVTQGRGVDKMKTFDSTLSNTTIGVESSIVMKHTSYVDG